MCLTIRGVYGASTSKYKPKAKIAKEPIVCYKVMKIADAKLTSFIRGFKYTIGRTYKATFGIHDRMASWTWQSTRWEIENGLHSYDNLQKLYREVAGTKDRIAVECKIPKGARYYNGTMDDIVSNKLKVVRIIPRMEIRKLLKAKKT